MMKRAKFLERPGGIALHRAAQRFTMNLIVAFIPAAVLRACFRQA